MDVVALISNLASKILSIIPLLENICKFALKYKHFIKIIDFMEGVRIKKNTRPYFALQCIGFSISLITLLITYFYSSNRFTLQSRYAFTGYIVVVFLFLSIFLGGLLILEFAFSRHFDLMVLIIDFFPGWGIIWNKFAVILMGVGMLCVLVSTSMAPSVGVQKVRSDFEPPEGFINSCK